MFVSLVDVLVGAPAAGNVAVPAKALCCAICAAFAWRSAYEPIMACSLAPYCGSVAYLPVSAAA